MTSLWFEGQGKNLMHSTKYLLKKKAFHCEPFNVHPPSCVWKHAVYHKQGIIISVPRLWFEAPQMASSKPSWCCVCTRPSRLLLPSGHFSSWPCSGQACRACGTSQCGRSWSTEPLQHCLHMSTPIWRGKKRRKKKNTIIVPVQICQAILADTPGSHCSVKSHQMQKAPHHDVDVFILWIHVQFNQTNFLLRISLETFPHTHTIVTILWGCMAKWLTHH